MWASIEARASEKIVRHASRADHRPPRPPRLSMHHAAKSSRCDLVFDHLRLAQIDLEAVLRELRRSRALVAPGRPDARSLVVTARCAMGSAAAFRARLTISCEARLHMITTFASAGAPSQCSLLTCGRDWCTKLETHVALALRGSPRLAGFSAGVTSVAFFHVLAHLSAALSQILELLVPSCASGHHYRLGPDPIWPCCRDPSPRRKASTSQLGLSPFPSLSSRCSQQRWHRRGRHCLLVLAALSASLLPGLWHVSS